MYHDFEYFLKWKALIKIEDTENKLSNSVIQQIQNIDYLPDSANQNRVRKNDDCLPDDRGMRLACGTNEEVCHLKGQGQLELEERENQINKQISLF